MIKATVNLHRLAIAVNWLLPIAFVASLLLGLSVNRWFHVATGVFWLSDDTQRLFRPCPAAARAAEKLWHRRSGTLFSRKSWARAAAVPLSQRHGRTSVQPGRAQ